MRRIFLVAAGVLLIIYKASASSVYSIDLPGLNGTYAYPSDPYTAVATSSFDFGVQFSSITSIEIVITASGEQGTYQSCLSGSCSVVTFGQTLLYGFSYESGYLPSPIGSIGVTQTPNTYSEIMSGIYDFLLDGAGSMFVQIDIPVFGGVFGQEVEFLSPTTLEVSGVILMVEASAVPIPATAWLFGSGLLGLIGIARKKS
jgi:hypothetical protein